MRGIVRGIGSVKVAGASYRLSRPSPIPFSNCGSVRTLERNGGAAAGVRLAVTAPFELS